jgi:hypothetical protein
MAAKLKPREPRGFACLSAERRRDISGKGGRAAHAKGTAHQFNHEEAVAAGQKGGQAAWRRGRAHRFTPAEAKAAGQKGQRERKERNFMNRKADAPDTG